jgi:hypothetical protein
MTDDNDDNVNTFLVSWDMYGVEMCKDITELLEQANLSEREGIFERIKNPEEEPPNEPLRLINRYVTMSSLRARMNPQRNYEVYVVKTSPEITEADMNRYFADDPQGAADMIRDRGTQLMSHRDNEPKRVIS